MSSKFSRRNLFRLRPADFVQVVRESCVEGQGNAGASSRPIRPPGALADEQEFLSVCERCAKCSEACDYNVIDHLGPVAGVAEGTPVLYPDKNPCHWCEGLPCVEACPSGALLFKPGPVRTAAPIAKVALNMETCLTAQGILCDTCAMICPHTANAITMVNRRPQLHLDRCTGCGLCVFHCESVPGSLTLVPGE